MHFKVKDIGISSGGPLIAILNPKDALRSDLHAGDRIKITYKNRSTSAAVDISEHLYAPHGNNKKHGIKEGEIALFEEVIEKLKLKDSPQVKIEYQDKPQSVDYIKKKLEGMTLSDSEINSIIKDLIDNKLTEIELTYFVSACYTKGLSENETVALTRAIVKNGSTLKLNKKMVFDKHCSGGVPNNRTSMIIVPIVSALGLTIPKTSSRSITSPAGTADTMEALAGVTFPVNKIKEIVKKTNGCLVWAGATSLASADDKLIKLRHPLSLDPEGMLLASILAKKVAVSSTHVLIDIPVGPKTKIKTIGQAINLERKFQKIARKLKLKLKVIITDGRQPIGNGIGPNLEAKDVLYILRRDPKAPKDLENKSIFMAIKILEMAKVKDAHQKVIECLESGRAYKKFQDIIKAQQGNPNIRPNDLKLGKYNYNYRAQRNGVVKQINTNIISKIARVAGAPLDKDAGIYLYKHINDNVRKNEILFTIYARSQKKLKYSKKTLDLSPIIY